MFVVLPQSIGGGDASADRGERKSSMLKRGVEHRLGILLRYEVLSFRTTWPVSIRASIEIVRDRRLLNAIRKRLQYAMGRFGPQPNPLLRGESADGFPNVFTVVAFEELCADAAPARAGIVHDAVAFD
jgi:hypothetical protein